MTSAAVRSDSGAADSAGLTAFLAAVLRAGFFAAPESTGGMASFNRRATGGSTVDDAERTNSPNSASLAKTTLLSTPSSLASS